MKSTKNIEKLIQKINVTPDARMDQKTLDDVLLAQEKSKKTSSADTSPNIWRIIIKNKMTKYAAAAVVIIAVLIGVKIITDSDKDNGQAIVGKQDITQKEIVPESPKGIKPELEKKFEAKLAAEKLVAELKDVEQMFAASDVAGLVYMLDKGQWESRIAAANYLAKMGDLSAINTLENLADKWEGDISDNPFTAAISGIRNRLEEKKQKTQPTKIVESKSETSDTKETIVEAKEMVVYNGLVTNQAGEPIQDVNVRCDLMYHRPWKFTGGEAHASTNMQGLFQIGPLTVIDRKKGSRTLIFEHPDYAIGWFTPDRSRDIEPNSIKIKLLESSFVTGVIVDEQGNPIEGTIVQARIQVKIDRQYYYYYFNEMNYRAVISDAEGYFYFEKIPNVAKLHLMATKQGYRTYSTSDGYQSDWYPISTGQEDVIIQLKPGASVRGQLVYDGSAYKEKDIIVYAQGDNHNCSGKTDENGRFEIHGLKEENYSIIVDVGYLSEAGLSCTAITNFEARLTNSIPEVELVLQKGLSVKVRIVDEDTGEPVRKVPVRARMLDDKNLTIASGQTNNRGICIFQLVPGEYNIVAYGWEDGKQHKFSKHLNIKSDNENLDVKLEIKSRPTVWGWLIDANDNPVQGTVALGRDPVKSDEHGEFAIPEPWSMPGETQIGYAFDKTKKLGRGFFWKKTNDANDLEIVVEPLASIMGRIANEDGEGVESLKPQIGIIMPNDMFRYSQQNPWKTVLEPEGHFYFENVPVGLPMKISVKKPGHQGHLDLPELKAGETLELEDIVLKPFYGFENGETDWTGILSGRVINEHNEPMMGLRIHTQTGGTLVSDTTDTRGRYKLSGLPKGKKVSGSVYADGYGHAMFKTICDGNDLDIQLFPQGWELLDKKAPGLFVEKWLNTDPVTLEQYQGKVVLLQIGILQPHYSQEFERIQNALKKYGNKGLQVIAIHERLSVTWGGKVTEQDIQAFIKKHDIKFPFGIDDSMHSLYDVKATPALYLIDKKGILRISPTRDNLDKWIKRLLAE
ncbi:MAG: redoxin domain-containing protein [Planctomycetota bacterium]|jgi:protocatechuate 3,4-dioxygenase beta subunit